MSRRTRGSRSFAVVSLGLALLTMTTACSRSSSPTASDSLPVLASFYPLQFIAQQIGGSFVSVTNLTKVGVDPHDLELSPQEVASVDDATSNGLLVYLDGFQPAVDSAVASASGSPARVLDVTPAAHLTVVSPSAETETISGIDPHFWLDPMRLASVAQLVASRLAQLDPAHAKSFEHRAQVVQAHLRVLNRQFAHGLKNCASRDLVTSHTAFGYLAARYHLVQHGIVGLNPEAEPNPAQLADIATFVQEHHVTTIFTEPLVSPAIADTVARETGTTTAVLDPLEGLTTSDPLANYFSIMRTNLAALRNGLDCS